ncbi:MAG: PIN domain-containing protein [Acidobacteriota bacterium]
MILVDTSVWIPVLRDTSGLVVADFRKQLGEDEPVLSRFTQLELLQGARGEREWRLLDDYLSTQVYLECAEKTWREAARIYFELRRLGKTVASPIDCCIAQLALDAGIRLLHRDTDFSTIATLRPLKSCWWDPPPSVSEGVQGAARTRSDDPVGV